MKKKICLVPIKNEAWILNDFLKAASLWADHIILLDQNSSDNSLLIASHFEKVILISNESNNYNELDRQRILINYSRKLFGINTILFALDADEVLCNFENNSDWDNLDLLNPGTAIYFPWLNVLPGNDTYFNSSIGRNVFGYIDDGRDHVGTEMHSPRVPVYSKEETVFIDSIKILHYQFAVRERQVSKHRWYECLEKIKYPNKDSINLYRMYHHIDLIPEKIYVIPNDWCQIYDKNNIFLKDIKDDGNHWWDKELCAMLKERGTHLFKKQYIWYVNWNAINEKYFNCKDNSLDDPRSAVDKVAHYWLNSSQTAPNTIINRVIAKAFRTLGW